jgi:hypothetical protein
MHVLGSVGLAHAERRKRSVFQLRSESGMAMAMGASGIDALPWSWKECTLLRV